MNKHFFGDNLDIRGKYARRADHLFVPGTERAEYPNPSTSSGQAFSLGQGTFKKAAVEEMSGEQERLL